jgi:hypothetical protein
LGEISGVLTIAERIGSAPAQVLLALALIGFMLGWWVPGWVYRLVVQEKNEWKRRALSGTTLAETAGDRLAAERRRRRQERDD